MQAISNRQIRMWSSMGQKMAVFGVALPEIAEKDKNMYVMTADLMKLSGLTRFQEMYPEQFLNVGIAEQNMIGIAAGLALEGNSVFATTYASFLTMRCYEQIRHNLGYHQANVKLIGSSSGLVMSFSGNTHYSYEDIALMRLIPNMTIVSPSDALEAYKLTHLLHQTEGPAYLRLSGGLQNPVVNPVDYELQIGKAIVLKPGSDAVVFTTGAMVSESLKAAAELEADGIQIKVINMHTIAPLDVEMIEEHLGAPLLVTVEEHRSVGGLYSAICEYTASKKAPLHISIGIPGYYLKAGDYEYLKRTAGLEAGAIAEKIRQALWKIKNG